MGKRRKARIGQRIGTVLDRAVAENAWNCGGLDTVAVAGPRPRSLSADDDEWLARSLSTLASVARQRGVRRASTGMALGVDTIWAKTAVASGLRLRCYVPFRGQADRWAVRDREEYNRLLADAATVHYISQSVAYPGAHVYHERNRLMCSEAGILFAAGQEKNLTAGTRSAVGAAKWAGIPAVLIDPVARAVTPLF